MPNAQVWNDGHITWREMFKEQEIIIPPGKFVEMEVTEAVQFMGQFVPPKKRSDEVGPGIEKRLRIVKFPHLNVPKVEFKCQMCKEEFQTEKSLLLHSEHEHKEAIIKDPKEGEANGKKSKG